MIVTVDSDLYYMKQYLESTGKYEVYNAAEYIGPVHAHIYQYETEKTLLEMQNSLVDLAQHEHIDIGHGVLMINVKNKTPREVEKILSERLYKNIF